VSIRAIADAVGVTPPSIYLHFADKSDLILAVCDDRFQELDRRMAQALAGAVDPLDEIRRIADTYVRFGLENPEQYHILFMGRKDSGGATMEQVQQWAALRRVFDAVERGIAAGLLRPLDPLLVVIGLWAGVHGLTSLMISKPDFPWPPLEAVIAHHCDQTLSGLAPR